MTNFQRGWPDDWADYTFKPVQRLEVFPKGTAKIRFWRGFWLGWMAGALVMGAGWTAAYAESLSISGSMVSIAPSDVPGEVAVITFHNVQVNNWQDDGEYTLAMPGLSVGIAFAWQVTESGSDRITVIPPDGYICEPRDCMATVPEMLSGEVRLLEWLGG